MVTHPPSSSSSSSITPQLRHDKLNSNWVIFSPARSKRPSEFKSKSPVSSSSDPNTQSQSCPFCLGNEHQCAPEIFRVPLDSGPNWKIRVIQNLYPAVSRDIQSDPDDVDGFGSGVLFGFGFHDVVIETPTHPVHLSDLPPSGVGEVLLAFKKRILQIASFDAIKYVQVFKNHGASAGASMSHSHSQIIALPVVPPNVSARLMAMKEHFEQAGNCILCELPPKELLIHESKHFISFVPFAASYAFEIWIVPRHHSVHFHHINEEHAEDLGGVLKLMLKKMALQLNNPPFNFMVHTSPLYPDESFLSCTHWYLQIVPQLTVLAGFEVATGCHINPVLPEDAAKVLRDVKIEMENIQIEGNTLGVKKALLHVCGRLQEWLHGEYSSTKDRRPLESTSQPAALDLCVDSHQGIAVSAAPTPSGPALVGRPLSSEVDSLRTSNSMSEVDSLRTSNSMSQPQDVVFRILCSNDRAGGVIGRGGSIIRALENETGASINFGPNVANSKERLVTIISKEDVESRYSPAQHAVILLFSRSVEVGVNIGLEAGLDKGCSVSAKIVVPSKQASSLLCRRGDVVSQMIKETGAGISIVRGDQVPRCCSEDDGVIEISGPFANVRDALLQVTSRLRSNPFANKVMNIPRCYTNTSLRSDPSLRAKVGGPSRMGFQQSSGSSQYIDRQAHRRPYLDPLLHPCKLGNSRSPKFQIQNPEMKGSVNTRTSINSDSVLTSANGVEVASANGPAIVNDTTKEILVPEDAINSVYGENGNNIARIRQISGAKVFVHEARTGSTDRIITISGTPNKIQAAQSLLHAFILTGSL